MRVLNNKARLVLLLGFALCAALTVGRGARPAAAQNPATFNVAPPELVGGPWLNTHEKASLTLASRKGKVTILHFWTFG